MSAPYIIKPHYAKFMKFYAKDDPAVPAELFSAAPCVPDLSGIDAPLPFSEETVVCSAIGDRGVLWFGGSAGLARYDENAERPNDRLMYFSADRNIQDNNVQALWARGDDIWVLTDKGVSHIEMRIVTGEEKALILTEESHIGVDRHGFMAHIRLQEDNNIHSRVHYGHCDNDGGFTAEYAIGEMMRYAVMVRERGKDSPEAAAAKKSALRGFEAALLMFFISGRGDGFVARTYVTTSEPVPNDGLFYKKENGRATCLDTNASRRMGISGKVIDASHPVPDRLAKIYRDEGYTDDDIIYKGDTSSDETTAHYMALYFAHIILGPEDPELDALIREAAASNMGHIIDHGFEMWECHGGPTTWAKWSPRYFATPHGYVDACLNSAQVLMYLKVTMAVTGEEGRWKEAYDELLGHGYADLPAKHFDRLHQLSSYLGMDLYEDIMYGDHALAILAFWGLITLEDDPELKDKYRAGYLSWRSSLEREYSPFSDFVYKLTCPDLPLDMERIMEWFYRADTSRIMRGVSLVGRKDIPVRFAKGGRDETDILLPPDERFLSKFDRNYYDYKNSDGGGARCVDSCYYYTLPYWMGRYYGFLQG